MTTGCNHTQIIWAGPLADKCQLCSASFGSTMYDAATRLGWANICQTCFDEYGCRLGTGRGQKYEKQE